MSMPFNSFTHASPWVSPLLCASEKHFQTSNYASKISKAIFKKPQERSFYKKWLSCVERIVEF